MQFMRLWDENASEEEPQPRRRNRNGGRPVVARGTPHMNGLINNNGYVHGNGNGCLNLGGNGDQINLGANPGDRKKVRNFDNRQGVQINNKGNHFNGDGNGGNINGNFIKN